MFWVFFFVCFLFVCFFFSVGMFTYLILTMKVASSISFSKKAGVVFRALNVY